MEYKEQILKTLVDKYRRSKKDTGKNQIRRRTKMKPSLVYADYYANNGDLACIMAVNEAAFALKDMGFVTCETEHFSYEIREIFLVDEKIETAEEYLQKQYGYESKASRIRYVQGLIETYGQRSPGAGQRCERLRRELEQNKLRKDYSEEEDLLKALVFVENNREPLFLREASMMIYGDSKYLEEHVLAGLCRILRASRKRPCKESELLDEILKEYKIRREVQRLAFKGPCTLVMAGGEPIETGVLPGGIELCGEDLQQLVRIKCRAETVITVENKTAYYRFERENTLVFYLGGYVTRLQRDFLRKLREDNETLRWLHFGDIDAGGFYILDHLRRRTEIPFQPYLMNVEVLKDARWRECLKKLSQEDVRRLKALLKRQEYRETVSYMLEKQVKLEQEIVCYYRMQEARGSL